MSIEFYGMAQTLHVGPSLARCDDESELPATDMVIGDVVYCRTSKKSYRVVSVGPVVYEEVAPKAFTDHLPFMSF